jgi:hypothetical protein
VGPSTKAKNPDIFVKLKNPPRHDSEAGKRGHGQENPHVW